jgi:hypothetical protein
MDVLVYFFSNLKREGFLRCVQGSRLIHNLLCSARPSSTVCVSLWFSDTRTVTSEQQGTNSIRIYTENRQRYPVFARDMFLSLSLSQYAEGKTLKEWRSNWGIEDTHVIKSQSQWPRAQFKAWTAFANSNAGIVDSNPTQGIDVCLRSFYVCVHSGFATGWSPVQGALQTVLGLRNWSETKHFTDALCSKVGETGRERERCN